MGGVVALVISCRATRRAGASAREMSRSCTLMTASAGSGSPLAQVMVPVTGSVSGSGDWQAARVRTAPSASPARCVAMRTLGRCGRAAGAEQACGPA
jgi:hypothetical protein